MKRVATLYKLHIRRGVPFSPAAPLHEQVTLLGARTAAGRHRQSLAEECPRKSAVPLAAALPYLALADKIANAQPPSRSKPHLDRSDQKHSPTRTQLTRP